MDGLTISELDEGEARYIGVRCALEALCRTDEPFTMDDVIHRAMEIEFFIQQGGTIHVMFSKDTTPKASGA